MVWMIGGIRRLAERAVKEKTAFFFLLQLVPCVVALEGKVGTAARP